MLGVFEALPVWETVSACVCDAVRDGVRLRVATWVVVPLAVWVRLGVPDCDRVPEAVIVSLGVEEGDCTCVIEGVPVSL